MPIARPISIIAPMSTPKIPATPSGPGVGGTSVCVTIKPPAKATPVVRRDLPPFFERAFAIG